MAYFTFQFLSGALILTSKLMLHICVRAMMILRSLNHLVRGKRKVDSKRKDDKKEQLRMNYPQWKQPEKATIDRQEDTLSTQNAKTETPRLDRRKTPTTREMTIEVFHYVPFILLLFNISLFFFGLTAVYTHIFAFAESQGMVSAMSSIMASVLGVSALAGRLMLSATMQQPRVDTFVLYIVSVFSCGEYVYGDYFSIWKTFTSQIAKHRCRGIHNLKQLTLA